MSSKLIQWLLTDKAGKKIYNQLCADGKAIKSSKDENGNSYHMLNIYDPDNKALTPTETIILYKYNKIVNITEYFSAA